MFPENIHENPYVEFRNKSWKNIYLYIRLNENWTFSNNMLYLYPILTCLTDVEWRTPYVKLCLSFNLDFFYWMPVPEIWKMVKEWVCKNLKWRYLMRMPGRMPLYLHLLFMLQRGCDLKFAPDHLTQRWGFDSVSFYYGISTLLQTDIWTRFDFSTLSVISDDLITYSHVPI